MRSPKAPLVLAATALLSLANGTTATAQSQDAPIVVPMAPFEGKRPVRGFYVKSSRDLVRKGTVQVDGTAFDLFLPKEKAGYSVRSRPELQAVLVTLTSTWLSVDQDHDGKITLDESYFAELPLCIGDTMFDVVDIAADGSSLTLRRREGPLAGPVLGRKAAAFEWNATDGRKLGNASYENRVLVIDCWAPG